MPQTLVSGSGNVDYIPPNQQQYRAPQSLVPFDPLFRPDYESHATPSSAVRQLTMTGAQEWNKTFTLEYPNERRLPIGSQQPQIVVNYMVRNPADAQQPQPIPIAQYAVNTGLIYVGQSAGTWGGIQVGNISGAPNGY